VLSEKPALSAGQLKLLSFRVSWNSCIGVVEAVGTTWLPPTYGVAGPTAQRHVTACRRYADRLPSLLPRKPSPFDVLTGFPQLDSGLLLFSWEPTTKCLC
jgi:hypothetical protein